MREIEPRTRRCDSVFFRASGRVRYFSSASCTRTNTRVFHHGAHVHQAFQQALLQEGDAHPDGTRRGRFPTTFQRRTAKIWNPFTRVIAETPSYSSHPPRLVSMPRVRPPSCTSSSLARSSPPSRPSVSPPRTTIHRPRRARRSRSGVRICRVSRHTFRSDVAAARVPMTDRDPSALSTIVRRLQRRDRRVQEHLVHRVGCRWPGQGTRARSTTTPLALSASRVRFERARFDRRAAARPINPRLQKVPDFFFSRAAS